MGANTALLRPVLSYVTAPFKAVFFLIFEKGAKKPEEKGTTAQRGKPKKTDSLCLLNKKIKKTDKAWNRL